MPLNELNCLLSAVGCLTVTALALIIPSRDWVPETTTPFPWLLFWTSERPEAEIQADIRKMNLMRAIGGLSGLLPFVLWMLERAGIPISDNYEGILELLVAPAIAAVLAVYPYLFLGQFRRDGLVKLLALFGYLNFAVSLLMDLAIWLTA